MKIRRFVLAVSAAMMVYGLATQPAQAASTSRKKGHLSEYSQPTRTYSQDPVDIVDTLGIRVGMTLAQAQAEAQKRGVVVPGPSPYDELAPNQQKLHKNGPNPLLFYLQIDFGNPPSAYTGPHYNQGFQVYVFPKRVNADYRDADNLIVFFVEAATNQLPFRMSHDAFVTKTRSAFPDMMDSASVPNLGQRRDHCHHAISEIRGTAVFKRLSYVRAGSTTITMSMASEEIKTAWRTCGDLLNVVVPAQPRRGTYTVRVYRYNYALAEEAFRNLGQVVGYTTEQESDAKGE